MCCENSDSLEGSRDDAALDPSHLVSRLQANWMQAVRLQKDVPPFLVQAEYYVVLLSALNKQD